MELTGGLMVFLVGCSGGAGAEILHWWNLRKNPRLPKYSAKKSYWLITAAMVVLGGFVAWLQFGDSGKGLIVFQIGLAAPIILQKLTVAFPEPSGSLSAGSSLAPQDSLRDFFRW